MPTSTRTFRVFVSSTFEDLKAERDALQRDVFPKLRKLCEENSAHFQAIDLRWGVRDEATLDQQTMEICLREIGRCQQTGVKPNFIVLLGERYGWRPLPTRIEAGEFDRICVRVIDADKRLIDDWYERDENAVPPEFLLKPRTGEFADKDRWSEVEQKLHHILREAARDARLAPESRVKYEASATHQEILKGLGQSEEERKHLFVFFREPAKGAAVDPELEALEEDLLHKLPKGNVRAFQIGEIEKLCKEVEESLKKVILEATSRSTSRDALDLEIDAHDRFARDRCRIFVGRVDALTTISSYLRGPERRPLVLHGASGSGKSAVIAVASEQYEGRGRLIRRFIGASPESANGHALLTSLCKQIAPGETPVEYYKLEKAFQERLATATAEQPLVIFIDALDQLSASDPAREARWLPAELPPLVKIVVSTTDYGERLPEGLQIPLERMTTAEGEQALDELLHASRRILQPWQREIVLAHFRRNGLPLYLKLAVEESKLWKSYTAEDACALGEGLTGVIGTLVDRLASNASHGRTLVEHSLGYLAAARYGLTEEEILDVLTADDAVWSDFDQRKHHEVNERRLPVIVWLRLSLDLEPYLTERAAPGGTVITFFHRQMAERAEAWREPRHLDLSRHFVTRPVWFDADRKVPNARRAVELVIQQLAAHQWEEAAITLLDCQFLFAKVMAGLVLDLDADLQALLQSGFRDFPVLRLVQGALRLSLNTVLQDPMQFAPQLIGRLLSRRTTLGAADFLDAFTASAPRAWLRPLHPCFDSPNDRTGEKNDRSRLLQTLQGHSKAVCSVAFMPDGKRVVSASGDATLKVWELATGEVLRTLAGHTDAVNCVALAADGKRIFSASEDGTLKTWDVNSGLALRTLKSRSPYLNSVAVTPDGTLGVTASWDLEVWDMQTGHRLRTLDGHYTFVRGVALTADGKHVISAASQADPGEKTMKAWNVQTGDEFRVLEGHHRNVNGVALTPDGRRVVSASDDKTLKVWDLSTGKTLRTMEGHSDSVLAVTVTPDGKRAVSASADKTLRLWDIDTGQLLITLTGHYKDVLSVAVAPDGLRAVSGSRDGTLKVWDIAATGGGDSQQASQRRFGAVTHVSVSPNEKRLVSESYDEKPFLEGVSQSLGVWDTESGTELRRMEGVWGFPGPTAVALDGKRVVTSGGHRVQVWYLEDGTNQDVSPTIHGRNAEAVTPDGKYVLLYLPSNNRRMAIMHELDTGVALCAFDDFGVQCHGFVVSPDGKRAIAAVDDELELWDLDSSTAAKATFYRGLILNKNAPFFMRLATRVLLAIRQVWRGHAEPIEVLSSKYRRYSGPIQGMAVTPDWKWVVLASDETLKICDLETGHEVRTLRGHQGRINSIVLTSDGGKIVSTSMDKSVTVWNLKTGLPIATFRSEGAAGCCACSCDTLIVAGDESGRIYMLALEE